MHSPPSRPSRDARRDFLRSAAAAASVALTGCAAGGASRAEADRGDEHGEAEVTPGEDLMQEHGLLERILLVYDEGARRIEHATSLDPAVLTGAAGIVQRFVEEYHEQLEEQFVFPRLEAAGRETALVAVLRTQHRRGRELTAAILRGGAAATADLAQALRSFVRMYRPHAAREDTVLFPAFRDVVGRSGYRELGEQFEDEEHRRFGEHGFATTVAEVARLEAALGIGDLAAFTP